MKKIILLLLAMVIGLLVSGCASFTKLPKPEEFTKPLIELKQEYPDLTKYENSSRKVFITIFGMPSVDPLIAMWGNPTLTGLQLQKDILNRGLLIVPLSWAFHPTRYWYWEFENKCIEVLIDRPLGFGYKPHVWMLSVSDGPCFNKHINGTE